jgi:hypothetical protein
MWGPREVCYLKHRATPDWNQVDAYALERAKSAGDVYGWWRLADEPAEAMFLVADSVKGSSFPKVLGGVRIRLKSIPEPRLQAR